MASGGRARPRERREACGVGARGVPGGRRTAPGAPRGARRWPGGPDGRGRRLGSTPRRAHAHDCAESGRADAKRLGSSSHRSRRC